MSAFCDEQAIVEAWQNRRRREICKHQRSKTQRVRDHVNVDPVRIAIGCDRQVMALFRAKETNLDRPQCPSIVMHETYA
eukprot:SAG11_NODE_327_length_10699_cov_4.828272_2_plen_79_part_00